MSEKRRAVRKVCGTVYLDDQPVGIMDTPELAAEVVKALDLLAETRAKNARAEERAKVRKGEPRRFALSDFMPQAPDDVAAVTGSQGEVWRRQPDGLWRIDKPNVMAGSWYDLLRVYGPVTEKLPGSPRGEEAKEAKP